MSVKRLSRVGKREKVKGKNFVDKAFPPRKGACIVQLSRPSIKSRWDKPPSRPLLLTHYGIYLATFAQWCEKVNLNSTITIS